MNEELTHFLRKNKKHIISVSLDNICNRDLNYYGKNEKVDTLNKINSLVEVIIRCTENNENGEMISYMHAISKERYKNGYILFEIQTVINYIEENIWKLLQKSDVENKVDALRMISSYMGIAKHELADDFIKYSSGDATL